MLKAITHNSKRFGYKKNSHYEFLYDRSFPEEKMLILFKQIEELLKKSKCFFKNVPGDTTTVALVEFEQQYFVVKRYNFRNFWHRIKLQFRKSHGFRSFFYSNLLSEKDIPSIKAVAVLQKKLGFLKRCSYFISQYEEGVPGCHYFKDDSPHKATWAETIGLISDIKKSLKENFIYHGDFHFGNFVIVDKKPILLDFDRIKMITHRKKFDKKHKKDLENFDRYLRRNPLAEREFERHLAT